VVQLLVNWGRSVKVVHTFYVSRDFLLFGIYAHSALNKGGIGIRASEGLSEASGGYLSLRATTVRLGAGGNLGASEGFLIKASGKGFLILVGTELIQLQSISLGWGMMNSRRWHFDRNTSCAGQGQNRTPKIWQLALSTADAMVQKLRAFAEVAAEREIRMRGESTYLSFCSALTPCSIMMGLTLWGVL
jgi:hypothetical protein